MGYPVGTKFISRSGRKNQQVQTVIDCLETRSTITGELYSTRYVTTHEFCGQTVKDYDVCATTIAMGELIK